jgi:hypothetical protein
MSRPTQSTASGDQSANDVVRLRIYGDSVEELYSIPLYRARI